MNYARIVNNIVAETSGNPNEQFHPIIAAQFVEVPEEVQAGWTVVDGQYLPPDTVPPSVPGNPPVPASVTPRQARLVLALTPSGDENFPTMLAKVEAAFGSLPEPQKTVAQITWEYSTEVQRTNPLVAQMKAVIGFTDEQIDQLFIQAATL